MAVRASGSGGKSRPARRAARWQLLVLGCGAVCCIDRLGAGAGTGARAGASTGNGAGAGAGAGAYEYGSPFGGYKASGNGREGGKMGLEDFLETKVVHGLF